MNEIATLERLALRAWPAEEERELEGWRLRAMRGVTRRANSVWTAEGAATDVELCIAAAELFYRERGLPARFQVSGASSPKDLGERLRARGYRSEAPVSVQAAASAEVAARARRVGEAHVDSTPSEPWLDISLRSGRFREVQPIYRALLERLGANALFALVTVEGTPAAVALGCVQGEYCGVSSMLTVAHHRRRGYATALLGALAASASRRGAGTLYLQVERENPAALGLYAKLGFSERYGYEYLTEPGAAPGH